MRRVSTLLLGLMSATALHAEAASFRDSFDKRSLDLKSWSAQQIEPGQITFQQPGRCGGAAIQVTVKSSDSGAACEGCQRAEVRVAQQLQPKYGDETWYSFSFRVQGDVPRYGTSRNVIGQFKGPMDVSPFLAQRIDNGMFHITVEDQGVRRVIAKSEGDPALMVKAQSVLSTFNASDTRSQAVMRNLQAVHRIARSTPDIATLLFTGDAQAGLRMPTGKEWNKVAGEKVAALFGVEGDDSAVAIRELALVNDLERYVGPADIVIVPGASPILPDPREGWVDMIYRIKGGRTDNAFGPRQQGEIDVWANGKHVVSVKGNFGNKLTASPLDTSQYFKFGIYRDTAAYEQKLVFDEFAQGSSRADVALSCSK